MWGFVSAVMLGKMYTTQSVRRCRAFSVMGVFICVALLTCAFIASSYALEAGRAVEQPVESQKEISRQQGKEQESVKHAETKQQGEPQKGFESSEKIKADKEVDFPSDI